MTQITNLLRKDADFIIRSALDAAMPDRAVKEALEGENLPDRIILVATGKAAWQMAAAAHASLGRKIRRGIVITKYGHSRGKLPRTDIFEAGHPVPDANSYAATRAAIELVQALGKNDFVLFLLSGGGSALFESPLVNPDELQDLTAQLLASGAEIREINVIRKRLSAVKGGKFAQICAPAKVFSVILSDVLGGDVASIASGPACADPSTSEEALAIAEKYRLSLSDHARSLLSAETPKSLRNARHKVIGSVEQLCQSAAEAAANLGYLPLILSSSLCCTARDAGSFLASVAVDHAHKGQSIAFIAGGETVVRLTGKGRGGRNQEIALAAAKQISGIENVCIFSVGSDGTDGPTDAAGGYADGKTFEALRSMGVSADAVLANNDSYHALKKCGGLIVTGPTGTNVNDLSMVLIRNHN